MVPSDVSLRKTKEKKIQETKQLQIKTIPKLPKIQSFPVPQKDPQICKF